MDEFEVYDEFDSFEFGLKAVTALDWINPIVDLTLLLDGYEPVHVPHAYRQEAAEVLGVRPHTFDAMHDCWVFMVEDQEYASQALISAGIPLEYV